MLMLPWTKNKKYVDLPNIFLFQHIPRISDVLNVGIWEYQATKNNHYLATSVASFLLRRSPSPRRCRQASVQEDAVVLGLEPLHAILLRSGKFWGKQWGWDVLWFETNQKPTKSPSSACEHSPPFPPSTCGSSHGCRAGRGARRSPCRRYRCQGRTWCPSQCAPECRIWKRVNKRGFRRFMQCLNISKQRSFLTNTCGLQPLQTWNPNAWLPSKQASWCLHPTKKTSFCMNDPIPWIQCHTNQQVSGRRKHVTKNNIPSALRQFLTLFKRKMDENGPSMDDVPWFTYVDRKQKTVIFPRIFLSYVP